MSTEGGGAPGLDPGAPGAEDRQPALPLAGGADAAETEAFSATVIRKLPRNVSAYVLAQAIVDFVECEKAYLEQASTRKRMRLHADGAVARYPRAKKRLADIAKELVKLNPPPRRTGR